MFGKKFKAIFGMGQEEEEEEDGRAEASEEKLPDAEEEETPKKRSRKPRAVPIKKENQEDPMEVDKSEEDDEKEEKPTTTIRLERPSRFSGAWRSKTRRPFGSDKLLKVNSHWKPLIKPSQEPMRHGATDLSNKKKRRLEREMLGLPRNVQPIVIQSKYPQFTISRQDLLKGCDSSRDTRFLELVESNGRMMPVDRWKSYTLVVAKLFHHDLGTFVTLDMALAAFAVNFYHDIKALLVGKRKKKIRVADVNYLFNDFWPRRLAERSKTPRPAVGPVRRPRAVEIKAEEEENE